MTKMNVPVEPPPKRGMGCFARGCLILVILGILLVVVGVGGSFWAVRNVYLSDKPVPIPEATAPAESTATPDETSVAAPSGTSAPVRERLNTMKKAARSRERSAVEFTAADINAMIAANRKSRGAAFVRIDDTVAQVQFSIPLERFDVPFRNAFGLSDRYLNATVSITAPPGTSASSVQLSEVTLNGHSIPTDLLDARLLGVGKSLRSYVIKYANQYGVTDGEIRDGKVLLYTGGQ